MRLSERQSTLAFASAFQRRILAISTGWHRANHFVAETAATPEAVSGANS
jgi:hypothetical protein